MIFKSFYIIFYIISVPVVFNIRDSFPTLLFFSIFKCTGTVWIRIRNTGTIWIQKKQD